MQNIQGSTIEIDFFFHRQQTLIKFLICFNSVAVIEMIPVSPKTFWFIFYVAHIPPLTYLINLFTFYAIRLQQKKPFYEINMEEKIL